MHMQETGDVERRVNAVVHSDGSFDIRAGAVALRGAAPAFDDRAVRWRAVRTEDDGVVYDLDQGQIAVRFAADERGLRVWSSIHGMRQAPHWFSPVSDARVEGAAYFYKQGLGFGGPSGHVSLASEGRNHENNRLVNFARSYDAFMAAGLYNPDTGALAVGPLAHDRFLYRATCRNRVHRLGLVECAPYHEHYVLDCSFATECIAVPEDGLQMPELLFVAERSVENALRSLACAMATVGRARVPRRVQCHWDSWYEAYHGFNRARLQEVLAGLRRISPPLPFRNIMVDESWCKIGDWFDADPQEYPGGLAAVFADIRAAGYAPGVWIGPFMVCHTSRVFREHPDWILKGPDGQPLLDSKGRGMFDGADYEERYYLDTSHPEAFEYIRSFFRFCREQGVTVYKIDFMDWGLKDSTRVRRFRPGKTSVEYFVDVLRMIREEIGDDAYWINCISPFGPSIGYADAQRVAYDTTPTWSGNLLNMFRETFACSYMTGILWNNDTDVMFLNPDPNIVQLSDCEVRSLALWIGMMSGVIAISNRMHCLTPSRLRLFRFVCPGPVFEPARVMRWERREDVYCAVRSYGSRDEHAVLFVNTSDQPRSAAYSMAELVGLSEAWAHDWAPGVMGTGVLRTVIEVELAGHDSRLLFVSARQKEPVHTLNLAGVEDPALGVGEHEPAGGGGTDAHKPIGMTGQA